MVAPGVSRQPPLPRARLGPRQVVRKRRGDDAASAFEQALGVAGNLGAREREAHVCEESLRPALRDRALGALVRLGRRRGYGVQAQLRSDLTKSSGFMTGL